jgi:hypothetical protein
MMLAKNIAKRTMLAVAFLLVSATLVCRGEGADAWPCFRGPSGMGVAQDDPRLAERWSKTENVRWVTEVPGWGWSCPIVSGGKVFLTAVVSENEYEKPQKGLYAGTGRAKPPEGLHRWLVYCLDLESGQILWQREAHREQPQVPRHPKSSYASETPVTDGQRVYALFGDVGLYCYDFEGRQLWSHRIEPKKSFFDYGAAASPVLCDGLVVLVYDNMEDRYIAAVDAQTGEQRWRTARPARAVLGTRSTWATPLVWKNELRTEIVTSDYGCIRSYDPRGNVLWELKAPTSNLIIPTPISAHGLVYVTSGYVGDRERPVYAIRPGAAGQSTLGEQSGGASARRLVAAASRAVQHVADRLRRLLLHAVGSWIHDLSRRENGRRGLRPNAVPGKRQFHFVALGLQREDLLSERRRRHLRGPGRPRIQGHRHQPAGRTLPGHAGGGRRQAAAAHRVAALLHRPRRRNCRFRAGELPPADAGGFFVPWPGPARRKFP